MSSGFDKNAPLCDKETGQPPAPRPDAHSSKARIANLQRIIRFITDVSGDIFIEAEPETGVLRHDSARLFRLCGVPPSCRRLDDLLEYFYERIHPDDKHRFLSAFAGKPPGGPPEDTGYRMACCRLTGPDGHTLALQITVYPFIDGDGKKAAYIYIKNLSARAESRGSSVGAGESSAQDELCNMDSLIERISAHLKSRKGVLVLYRLDNLELLRDRGLPRGELEATAGFVRLLRGGIRNSDYICRTEAGHFIVFITGDRGEESLRSGIRDIAAGFAEFLAVSGMPREVGISAGFAFAPRDGKNFESLLTTAERALVPCHE